MADEIETENLLFVDEIEIFLQYIEEDILFCEFTADAQRRTVVNIMGFKWFSVTMLLL